MDKFKVGELFQKGITRYQEGVKFDFTQSGAVLLIFFNMPTNKEIESIRSGNFEVRFFEKDGVIFFLSKFKGMPWMDAPYTVHLSKLFEFMEFESDTQGFGLQVFLIDASNGVINAMRYVGLCNNFSKKIRSAIENQKKMQFDNSAYNSSIDTIYRDYSTDDIVQRASAYCKIK